MLLPRRYLSSMVRPTSRFVVFQALNEQLCRCQSAGEVERLILSTPAANFNDVNCSTAISMLGKKKSSNASAIDVCLFIAKSHTTSTGGFQPRHLSNMCFGIASGRLKPSLPRFLLDQILRANLDKFNSQDLANTLWSLAKLNHQQQQQEDEEDEGLVMRVCGRFAAHLIARSQLVLHNKQTDLALLLWSFVTLGYHNNNDNELLDCLCTQLVKCSSPWRAHNVANSLWALGTANYYSAGVCQLLAEEIARSGARDFNPQDLANTLWAFSALRFKHEPALRALCDRVCQREVTNPRGRGSAAATARAPQQQTSFVSELMQKIKPASASPVFTSASSAAHTLPILLERLEGKPPASSSSSAVAVNNNSKRCFTPQNLASTLMSLANLDYVHLPCIESIAEEVVQNHARLGGFQSQHVFNMVWAFACLDVLSFRSVRAFFQLSPPPEFELDFHLLPQAQQLVQADMAWRQQQQQQPKGTAATASLPPLLAALGENAWHARMVERQAASAASATGDESPPVSSQVHLAIARVLREDFFPELQSETYVSQGRLSVDILLASHRAVVEIDGPTHFLRQAEGDEGGGEEEQPTGRTKFKHRLLQGEGFHVFSISVRKYEQNSRKRTALGVLAKRIQEM